MNGKRATVTAVADRLRGEAMPDVAYMIENCFAEVERLSAINAELVAALQDLRCNCADLIPDYYRERIDVAIAKARGSRP